MKVYENRVLNRIFLPKREEVMGGSKNLIMRNFIDCTPRQISLE
jgi:hypothetical protein